MLPYDDIQMRKCPDLYMDKLEEMLNTADDSDIGYFVEVILRYPDNIKEKTTIFPFCPATKIITNDKYNDYMKSINPKIYKKFKKFICHWTVKKNYLVH